MHAGYLERLLVYVQSLADEEAEAETNATVRPWMKALKAVAYQAADFQYDFHGEQDTDQLRGCLVSQLPCFA
jgi:hypothetical protein